MRSRTIVISENPAEKPAKRRRSKDGCRPCRMRKKKCDGRKPGCVSCERNVLLCSWFPTTKTDPELSTPTDYTASDPEFDDKRRKISPELSDVSTPGADFLRPLSWEADEEYSTPAILHSDIDLYDITALRRQPSLDPIFRSSTSLLLYQHWVDRTGDVMSAHRGKFNAFKTELPRLAVAYPDTVLQAVLACSGIHYCNSNKNPEVEASAWTHLGLALRSLKYGLTRLVADPRTDPVPLLSTTLVLCFVETTRGDSNGVLSHHLRAAHILFNTVLSSPSSKYIDESMLAFLKEFYIYILRITELSNDSQIIALHTTSLRQPLEGDFSWLSDKSYGMLVGCSYELFDMIPQVSALVRRRRQRAKETSEAGSLGGYQTNSDTEDMAYRILRSRILSWQPPFDATQDFITCGSIYQQAIICHLDAAFANPPITPHTPLPDFIMERFEKLEFLLLELPLDAPISHTLCWPLALFGSFARLDRHRELIMHRLQAMWDFLRLGNVRTTMKFLKALWEDDSLSTPKSPSTAGSASDEDPFSCVLSQRTRRKRPAKVAHDPNDMEALMKRCKLMFSFA